MAHSTTSDNDTGKRPHKAGIFDIRTFIGALLGVYGVILTLTGLFATNDEELAKTDDFNINLVAGIALIVASAAFVLWARLRPVVVPKDHEQAEE
jgi:uncharacterized membrane protein